MIFHTNSSILVIFCRRPMPGIGKQRIAASLGKQKALEISELLLHAAIEDARDWPGPVVIAPASAADSDWAMALLPDAVVIPQQGDTLGSRIQYVDKQILAQGGEHILIIGSDAPALTPYMLTMAAESLQTHDAVLIPARDGGVTLMGSAKNWPDLTELPWESPQLAEALRAACTRHDLSISTLPESYDIDTRDDLLFARDDLAADPRTTRQKIANWINHSLVRQDRISVIIPVLNDLPALDSLLMQLISMRGGVDEVIVVDGGADPECMRLCELRDAHYVQSDPCRGQQLAIGAEQSAGDILWFLHADSEPPSDAPEQIREHLQHGCNGGFFRFRFLGEQRWYKTLLQWAINLRVKIGTPYGDQGLFIGREAYTHSKGFAATPLFEEVRLVRELRRQPGNRGFHALNTSIGVSPRRWERDGWLKRTLHNRYLACAFMLGVTPNKLVQQYRTSEQPD
jgi:rSAM/selenodomain-associated transferase 2/rSAM/selenodomain-associated transferase 1